MESPLKRVIVVILTVTPAILAGWRFDAAKIRQVQTGQCDLGHVRMRLASLIRIALFSRWPSASRFTVRFDGLASSCGSGRVCHAASHVGSEARSPMRSAALQISAARVASCLFIAVHCRSQCRRASADLWTTNRQDGDLARFLTKKIPKETSKEKVWASEAGGRVFQSVKRQREYQNYRSGPPELTGSASSMPTLIGAAMIAAAILLSTFINALGTPLCRLRRSDRRERVAGRSPDRQRLQMPRAGPRQGLLRGEIATGSVPERHEARESPGSGLRANPETASERPSESDYIARAMPRATKPHPLTKTEARRIWLRAQRLDTPDAVRRGAGRPPPLRWSISAMCRSTPST